MDDKLTKEKAYEILQLDPSESLDKVKAKYENYMRRAKFDDAFDDVVITKAYDTIMGIDWGNFKPDSAYSEKGLNKKKIENFFYHNTRKLIYGTIVFVLIIATLLMVILGKVRYDYKISLLGQLTISDHEVMALYYEELIDEKNVLIDYYIVGGGEDAVLSEGFINKLFGDLQDGESDLFIIVPEYAKFLSYEGALTDLSPYLADFGISPDDKNILYWYKEGGDEIAIAYRFGNKSILNKGMSGRVPEYFAIPHRAEYSEQTKTIILDLINQNK